MTSATNAAVVKAPFGNARLVVGANKNPVNQMPDAKLAGIAAGRMRWVISNWFWYKIGPKPSDETIAKIAEANGGRYSMTAHMEDDVSAKPEHVQAHIRRLEALRRHGAHAWREDDGVWRIPHDYLDRATDYEKQMASKRPVSVERLSHLKLSQMKGAIGATWLDEQLRDFDDDLNSRGFGAEVETARAARRNFLKKQGVIAKDQHRLTQDNLESGRTQIPRLGRCKRGGRQVVAERLSPCAG